MARAVCAGAPSSWNMYPLGNQNSLTKKLAVLLFTNTTSQMTSLMISWLLVIMNHLKNFERFNDFRAQVFVQSF